MNYKTKANFLDLYQTLILHHSKNPKNFYKIETSCCCLNGQNKMCGDYIYIYLAFDKKDQSKTTTSISNISFQGQGCAILIASASMMTEIIKGKTLSEVENIIQNFIQLITGELAYSEELNELNIFSGISNFQSRLQCARLPWDTLNQGLATC